MFVSWEERDSCRQRRPPSLIFGLFRLKLSNYKSMIKTCRNFIVNSNWPPVNTLGEKNFPLPKHMGQNACSTGLQPTRACSPGSSSRFSTAAAVREGPEHSRDLGARAPSTLSFSTALGLWKPFHLIGPQIPRV